MISDEKRREAANMLRRQAHFMMMNEDWWARNERNVTACGNAAYRDIAYAVIPQGNLSDDYRGIVDKLADLIDRPTCEMRYDSVHVDYVCSRCGQHYQYFETYDGDGHPVPFKYCPTCGSEVVEK